MIEPQKAQMCFCALLRPVLVTLYVFRFVESRRFTLVALMLVGPANPGSAVGGVPEDGLFGFTVWTGNDEVPIEGLAV